MPISRIGTDGIENGAVAPADLSTGGPSWDGSGNVTVGTIKTNVGGVEGIQLATDLNTSSVSSRLFFSETGSTVALFNSSGNLLFNTGVTKGSSSGTTRVAFGATGIGLGNTISNSGVGITFPATQSASSDANTLDDYEEGTWTPAITYGDSTGTVTFSEATYTKVGRLVSIFLTMTPSTTFAVNSSSGTPRITGLPFTLAKGSAGNFAVNVAGAPQTYFLTAYIHPNGWILLPSFAATSNVFYFAGIYYV